MIIEEVKKELTGHIIPFWNKLRDDENGGFYGFMSYDLKLDKQADKGVILHARILWFYSKAYITLGDKTLLDNARHAYEFIKNHCIDYEYGGVYWMMNYKGEPADTMKHTYNIAFAIYALSCYYNASGDKEALELAYKLSTTSRTTLSMSMATEKLLTDSGTWYQMTLFLRMACMLTRQ